MLKLDLAVLALYFVAVLAIGGCFARGQKSLQEFLLAKRSIPWWAASISGIATMMNGAPEEINDLADGSTL